MHDPLGRLYRIFGHLRRRPGTFTDISRDVYHLHLQIRPFGRETRTSENFRLRAALTKAGMLPDDLADRVEVDIKTVGRWLSGRTPHPRHRALVAQALAADELELWPEAKPTNSAEDPFKEIAGAWPDSSHTGAPDWLAMLDAATEQIDLLDLTLYGIVTETGVVKQLAAKAARGTQVRILIGAQTIYLTAHEEELGRELDRETSDERPLIERERDQALPVLATLLNQPGVEVREFVAGRFNTILRFDQQMLVTLHLYGLTRPQAPQLHLRRRQDNGIFDQFAEHFQRIWGHASDPLELDTVKDDLPEEPPSAQQPALDANSPPAPHQAQRALERLRAHRPI